MKSIKIQARCCASIVSTVATKWANGPVKTSTLSPGFRAAGGNIFPSSSQRSIRLEISCNGKGFGVPSKLTSRETPKVLLILLHGAEFISMPTNMYPGNRGLRSVMKRDVFRRATSCNGRNVSKPWRWRFRSAKRCELGLNWMRYHCAISVLPPLCSCLNNSWDESSLQSR